jgi:nitrate/nitrite transporter NarK
VVSAKHQGKAMGIAGAGNSGTVFAALLAPVLAAARSAGATCSVSP